MTENNIKLSIYAKLAKVQGKIKGIDRTKQNKHQGYKYFSEEDAIKELKPLLAEVELSCNFSDDPDPAFYFIEKDDKKNYVMRYRKLATIGDNDNSIVFYF